jgi:hypothetical protein
LSKQQTKCAIHPCDGQKTSKQRTKCAIHPCDDQKTSKQQTKCAFHGIALKKKHLRASPSPHQQKKNSFILEWNMV